MQETQKSEKERKNNIKTFVYKSSKNKNHLKGSSNTAHIFR